MRRQPIKPRLLERGIVIIIEIVIAEYLITTRQQALCEVRADEAGGAGNQNAHGDPVSIRGQRLYTTVDLFARPHALDIEQYRAGFSQGPHAADWKGTRPTSSH